MESDSFFFQLFKQIPRHFQSLSRASFQNEGQAPSRNRADSRSRKVHD